MLFEGYCSSAAADGGLQVDNGSAVHQLHDDELRTVILFVRGVLNPAFGGYTLSRKC